VLFTTVIVPVTGKRPVFTRYKVASAIPFGVPVLPVQYQLDDSEPTGGATVASPKVGGGVVGTAPLA
jgi:hypothetical protein